MDVNNPLNINESLSEYVTSDIIVVGAGISGLTVANELNLAGTGVTVYEKARGTGGRLGSKRLKITDAVSANHAPDDAQADLSVGFDLGASSFSAKTAEFQQYLQELMLQNIVAKTDDSKGDYVAISRNSMLTRHLSKDINVSFSTKITGIEFKDGKWFLFGEPQADQRQPQKSTVNVSKYVGYQYQSENVIACCKHLVLAAPAEQTTALLPKDHAALSWLTNINSDPVFVSSFILPSETLKDDDLNTIRQLSNTVIAEVSIEHAKPDRQNNGFQIIKLTTTSEWAQEHITKPLNEIESQLQTIFNETLSNLDINQTHTVTQYTHRWLYSQYSDLIKNTKGYLSFSDNLHIVGDYFDVQSEQNENAGVSNHQSEKIEGVERAYISAQRLVSNLFESMLINDGIHDKFSSKSL